MKRLSRETVDFFLNQGCVIVTTIDENNMPHSACKGIVKVTAGGKVYLLDLYRGRTFANLKRNPNISVTAVDEHRFKGYCLKGKADIVTPEGLNASLVKAWENRINQRITQRVLKNISGQKGHPRHPEVLLPNPQYLVAMEVEEAVDLTPHHLKMMV